MEGRGEGSRQPYLQQVAWASAQVALPRPPTSVLTMAPLAEAIKVAQNGFHYCAGEVVPGGPAGWPGCEAQVEPAVWPKRGGAWARLYRAPRPTLDGEVGTSCELVARE